MNATGLEVFHEDGDDDVDEDELSDEHEDDEVDGSDERIHAAVVLAVGRVVAVVTQRVLYRPAPTRPPASPTPITRKRSVSADLRRRCNKFLNEAIFSAVAALACTVIQLNGATSARSKSNHSKSQLGLPHYHSLFFFVRVIHPHEQHTARL